MGSCNHIVLYLPCRMSIGGAENLKKEFTNRVYRNML